MTYFFLILILGFIAWQAGVRNESVLDKKWFWLGLTIRIAASLSLGLIYFFWIGQGDTISFFNQAVDLANTARIDPREYIEFLFSSQHELYKSEGRDGFFVKILSLFCLLSDDNYWITSLYFALLSFLPIWVFMNQIVAVFPTHKWSLIIAFLLLPSPIFWTSGILKDTFVFSSLLIAMTFSFKLYKARGLKWFDFLILTVSLFFLWKLRYFLFGLTVAALTIVFADRFLIRMISSVRLKVFAWMALLALVILGISFINPNLYFFNFPQAIYDNYILIINHSDPSKSITFRHLEPTWQSLLRCAPLSFLSGLFRPLIFEGSHYLFIHTLENTFLLLISIFSITKVKSVSQNLLIWMALSYIILLSTFLPLASPNFGSLMRYKAAYLPLLFYLVSIIPFKSVLLNKGEKH